MRNQDNWSVVSLIWVRMMQAVFFAGIIFLGGCATVSYTPYTGAEGTQIQGATPVDEMGIKFMLPPGWGKGKGLDTTKNATLLNKFLLGSSNAIQFNKSDDTFLVTYCWKGMVGGGTKGYEDLAEIAAAPVDEHFPDSEITIGPYEIDTGKGKLGPAFQVYQGNQVVEGVEIPFRIYIAWKGGMGFGCRYTLLAATPQHKDDILDEFLSVVRTLD